MRIWGFRDIAPTQGRGDFPETQIRIETPPVILLP